MVRYPLTDPFYRDFVIDDEQKKFITKKLKESEQYMEHAATYSGRNGVVKDDFRSCYHVSLNHYEFFDVSVTLKEMLDEWNPDCDVPDLWFAQVEFVRYLPPAQTFGPHRDDNEHGTDFNRFYTSVTMVDKSDDLEGGILRVWLPNTEARIDIDLEPWETVVFPAYFRHEASPVYKGRRVILISWAQHGAYAHHSGEVPDLFND